MERLSSPQDRDAQVLDVVPRNSTDDLPEEDEAAISAASPPDAPPVKAKTRRFFHKIWFWVLLGLGAGVTGGVIWLEQERQAIIETLPDPQAIFSYARPDTLTILADDGSVLQKIGPATRDYHKLTAIPPRLQQAFLAAEDRRYYQHTGVDYQSIVRAIKANVQAGEVVEGGSTITQQLARVVFLDQDPSVNRKIREALLAQKISQTLTKEEVLERYLNLVYLGSGAYGVADAAWIYYSKTLDQLTLSEMATLAGMPPAPSVYSPLINPEFARQRRNKVLTWMLRENFITAAEAAEAEAEAITVNPSAPRYFDSLSPYFTTFVKKELPQYLSPERIAQGGLVLETTLNLDWQSTAEAQLRNLVLNEGYYQNFDQAAFVVVEPQTGSIKVMVGGADFESSQFNRATQAQRQPGSTFKVFVYTAAIATGILPSKTYVDAPLSIDGYKPKNYGGNFRGTVSLVDALVSSINIVSLKALLDVGFEPVISTAHKMGLRSEMQDTYSLALGAWEMNLLEMTSAYGTLANQGLHVPAHGIRRIRTEGGELLYDVAQEPTEQAVDADTANIMTWMLQQVVDRGTGGNAKLYDRPVAGKTGTSESARDLWFIGYIPQLVAGVWLGNDDNRSTWGASATAALLWGNIMDSITQDLEPQEFPPVPPLEGREGTLEAQPVKPKKLEQGSASAQESGYDDSAYDSYDSYDSSGSSGSSGSSAESYNDDYDYREPSGSASSGYSDGGGDASEPSDGQTSSGSADYESEAPVYDAGADQGSSGNAPTETFDDPGFSAPADPPPPPPPPPPAAIDAPSSE